MRNVYSIFAIPGTDSITILMRFPRFVRIVFFLLLLMACLKSSLYITVEE